MYKIAFFVPESHLEPVKEAMFAAGAARIGNYDKCAWQCKGTGQYRPLEGNNAWQGETDKLERIEEWKVEMVCEDALMKTVIDAMKIAHPYETPAYDVWALANF